MAMVRVSPGVYRDTTTGALQHQNVRSNQTPSPTHQGAAPLPNPQSIYGGNQAPNQPQAQPPPPAPTPTYGAFANPNPQPQWQGPQKVFGAGGFNARPPAPVPASITRPPAPLPGPIQQATQRLQNSSY